MAMPEGVEIGIGPWESVIVVKKIDVHVHVIGSLGINGQIS